MKLYTSYLLPNINQKWYLSMYKWLINPCIALGWNAICTVLEIYHEKNWKLLTVVVNSRNLSTTEETSC